MKNRNFHLYVLILSAMLAISGALAACALLMSWPVTIAIICFLAVLFLIAAMWEAASFLPSQVKYFMGCIKFGDSMSRFPDTRDPELAEMYQIMNSLMQTCGAASMDLETKRAYYDRILRIMTHELRNSITPIISVSSDMLKREYQPSDLREAVEVIHEQSSGIRQFLDGYYELTHLPKPLMKPVELSALLASVARLYPKGVVEIMCAQHLVLSCDEVMIRQMIVNLAKNAIEAVGESRAQDLAAQGLPAIQIIATQPNGQPRIVVSDRGPGIPSGKIEEIFLPFYTSKTGGCGIGLAISRQIMSLHGGTLTCASGENGGADFVAQFC